MLIDCRECGGKVSDKANACPHCGAPIITRVNLIVQILIWLRSFSWTETLMRRFAAKRRELIEQRARNKVRRFSYKLMPYKNPKYASLDCEKIREALVKACSSREIMSILSSFPTPRDGYSANLPWFKECGQVKIFKDEFVTALFCAYIFDDLALCDELIRPGHVLSKEYAGIAFRRFCKPGYGEKEQSFLKRYIPMDMSSIVEYAKWMRWLPLIEAHDFDSLNFYKNMGIEMKIGDEGFRTRSNIDGVDFYMAISESPLSNALDEDNIERLRLLLKWGANPNQFLCCCCGRWKDAVPVHSSPLLYKIKSVDAYKLMKAGGMVDYPVPDSRRPNECCNLVEHLWCGDTLTGDGLALLYYLYETKYDKPLADRLVEIEKAFNNGNYKNNNAIVLEWLRRNSWRDKIA